MTVNMDPSLPTGHPPATRAPGDVALPRQPLAAATPVSAVAALPGAAPSDGAAPVPAPAPPAQKTQVSISPQGRQSVGEAALQRQAILLDALAPAPTAAAPRAPAGTAALPGPSAPAAPGTTSPALPQTPSGTAPLPGPSAPAAPGTTSPALPQTPAGTAPLPGPSAPAAPGTASPALPQTPAGAVALPAPSGLAALGTASAASAASAAPTSATSASAQVAPASGVPPPAPALGAARLDAAGALARPAGASSGAAPVSTPAAPAATLATAGAARLAWPSGGVSAPLQSLVSALVQQTTAPVQAQRVLAIQPWPAALLAQVDGAAAAGPSGGARADGPAPLQTWLVRQGVVQTPEGPRGVSLTVRVPGPWLEALGQTQAAATPTRSWQVWLLPTVPHTPAPVVPLQAAFAGPLQALQSGTFALALESSGAAGTAGTAGAAGAAGGRTSALLTLEFQPLLLAPAAAQAAVYGREVAHPRQDPWLQMAALQASGQVERDEERARHGSAALCDTPGCPYLARAACVQPFCAVLQVVPQVASVQAPGAPGLGS